MLIAHLSDFHIAGENKKAYGLVPSAENLALCIRHINTLRPKPDLVIITGDITCDGKLEEAERAAAILENLQYPYFIVPGNHDDRDTLWSVFGKYACPGGSKDFINYVIDEHDLRLIGMDSSISTAPGGELCDKRIAWLEKQLSIEPAKPTIIFMHHPPANCGVLETDEDGFIGAENLGHVLKQHANVKAILCGHIHTLTHLGWHGAVISTAPSMGLQLVLDLTLTQPSQFNREAPGYLLHYFTPDENLVTHSILVKDIDGPYPF
jgi:3',5'-cyclic AMP phosphodiesterase CpdA